MSEPAMTEAFPRCIARNDDGAQCVRPTGHEGTHRTFVGQEWPPDECLWMSLRGRVCELPPEHSGPHRENGDDGIQIWIGGVPPDDGQARAWVTERAQRERVRQAELVLSVFREQLEARVSEHRDRLDDGGITPGELLTAASRYLGSVEVLNMLDSIQAEAQA